MSSTIENMIKKIIVVEDYSQLMDEIINDETVQLEHLIVSIFDNVQQIENQVKMDTLAKIIAGASFKKQRLIDVYNQINYFNDNQPSASKKTFVKKILKETGKISLCHCSEQTSMT
jgi:hypothetical protein